MPIIDANYLAYLADAKKIGSHRSDAEKEMLRQDLKASLLATLATDLELENRRGGRDVKELVLRGRAFFNQGEYLKNFSEEEIRAGAHLELLKELGQRVRQIKEETDSFAKTNAFLYQQLAEVILPIISTPGADAQILVTRLSRTDLLLKPPEQAASEAIAQAAQQEGTGAQQGAQEAHALPEPPKKEKKSFFSRLGGLFGKRGQ
ncbi:MAG: hypothetical protein NTY90_03000 [Candidatus Micrarchaeota archaeon]|nr:hypothetical protein [Candidatus Micrarchaeota archaeon]